MSNRSILTRLEARVSEYELGSISRQEFVKFLSISTEALESIPYSVTIQLRSYENTIETQGYFEEEGFQSTLSSAISGLKDLIGQLKATYGGAA